ncbi:hypothetical protein CCUS01_14859 [Colletotrichum cuscutae]|uniref:Uncharacterized protein n=1 Tax=Colletotrichum cuscutae TaxID=1209917 RepID=A0AAI9Y6E3_9PEZI|nr:hypothetical protein CCUS01_14859 [Colletotrichum cuscutae]
MDQCPTRYGPESRRDYYLLRTRRGFAASNQGSRCTLVCGPAVRHNDGRMLRRTGREAR